MRYLLLFFILGLLGCGAKEKAPAEVVKDTGTAAPDTRVYWKHENGHFEKIDDGTWKEVAADGGHTFNETNRTAEMIELTDRQRNIVISLFNSDCTAKVGSNKPTRLYDGLWLEKPAGKLSPDPAMANKLAAEFDLNGYRIRPPVGWTLEEKTQGGTKSFNWTGQRRADGSAPRFWVMVGKLSPMEQSATLDKGMATLQNPLRSSLAGYGESPFENTDMGGLKFLRMSFKGVETVGPDPLPISGIVYHTHDGAVYVHIKLIDKQQFAADSYPILETAAKTLRKP